MQIMYVIILLTDLMLEIGKELEFHGICPAHAVRMGLKRTALEDFKVLNESILILCGGKRRRLSSG